jgi:hypothetical protein
MTEKKRYKQPDWYDKDMLIRVSYAATEVGWAVDLGDGTCRLTNVPCGAAEDPYSPRWGDRCELRAGVRPDGIPIIDRIIERYNPLDDLIEVRKQTLPEPVPPPVFSDARGEIDGFDRHDFNP